MPARQSAFPCPVRSRNSSAARRRTQRESRSTCRCGNGLTRATVARATNSISPPSRRRSRRSASTTAGDRRAAVSTQPGPQAAALGQSYPVPTFASVRVEYADGSFREFHVHKPVRADVTISGIVRGLPDLDADLAPRSGRSHPAEHPAFPVPPPAEARCAAAPEVLRSRPPPAAAPRPAAGWQSRRIVRWLRAASWDRKASPDTGEPREPPAMRWRTQSTRRARCGSYPGTVLAPVPAAWRRPWRASAYRSPPRRKTWFQIGPVPPLHCRQTSYPTHCAGHAAGAGAPPESTARHLQTRCSSCDTLFQPRGVRRYGLPLPDWHGDYKGGSLRWIRLEGDPAAVFLDDDAARQRQALTGAAPHLLGGKELVEDPRSDSLGNATSRIADRHRDVVAVRARLHPNSSLNAVALHHGSDGVHGIHQQVEKYLVQVRQVAYHRRQIAEIGLHVGHVFQFIAGHRQGVLQRLVQVRRHFLLLARMGERLHRPYDGRNPFDAIQRLLQGIGDLRVQVFHVRRRLHLFPEVQLGRAPCR